MQSITKTNVNSLSANPTKEIIITKKVNVNFHLAAANHALSLA